MNCKKSRKPLEGGAKRVYGVRGGGRSGRGGSEKRGTGGHFGIKETGENGAGSSRAFGRPRKTEEKEPKARIQIALQSYTRTYSYGGTGDKGDKGRGKGKGGNNFFLYCTLKRSKQ